MDDSDGDSPVPGTPNDPKTQKDAFEEKSEHGFCISHFEEVTEAGKKYYRCKLCFNEAKTEKEKKRSLLAKCESKGNIRNHFKAFHNSKDNKSLADLAAKQPVGQKSKDMLANFVAATHNSVSICESESFRELLRHARTCKMMNLHFWKRLADKL